jgi:hypothetical protein
MFDVPQQDYHELPAGTPGWQFAPVPGWGKNPLRAGPARVGVGAAFSPGIVPVNRLTHIARRRGDTSCSPLREASRSASCSVARGGKARSGSMRRNTHLPKSAYLTDAKAGYEIQGDLFDAFVDSEYFSRRHRAGDAVDLEFFRHPDTEKFGVEILVEDYEGAVTAYIWERDTLLEAISAVLDDIEKGDLEDAYRSGLFAKNAESYEEQAAKYRWFVVSDGEVVSGWEFREDADDAVEDTPGDVVKIVAKSRLARMGLRPEV